MRNTINSIIFLSALFFISSACMAQQKAAYQVPASYDFDHEVVQQVNGKKSNETLTYYYTQSGDYTALSGGSKEKAIIIYTKDRNMVIIDDQKKSITIMHMQGLIGDMTKIAEQYKKDNPTGTPKHDSSSFKFGKTGNTKQIDGYTSEEYSFTDSKGQKGSVWYAKVDFNASSFFMMGAAAGPGMSRSRQSQDYPQFADGHQLMTEVESASNPDGHLTTQSISKKSFSISTKGYTVNDFSSLTAPR